MRSIAQGIRWWTARHPEWHPRTGFGALVGSYALDLGDATLLVDPIAPGGDVDALVARLGPALGPRAHVVVTIPYHVRDSERLLGALLDAGIDADLRGHPAAARRLSDPARLVPLEAGVPFADGVLPVRIGNPRRSETPLYVPGHRALVFGDAVVTDGGRARVWVQQPLTPARVDWYQRRLRPSLEPLTAFAVDRLLTTHGPPVRRGGGAALRRALDDGPWYHRPS